MSRIQLFKQDPDTLERELLGVITKAQLDFLIENLEEEFEEDRAYYVDRAAVDFLKEQGTDEELIKLLEKGLGFAGPEEGIEIAYLRQ